MKLQCGLLRKSKRVWSIAWVGILLLLSSACVTGLKVSKKQYEPLKGTFSGTFKNIAYKTSGKKSDRTLLKLFRVFNITADSITIRIQESGFVTIEFYDSLSYRKDKVRKEVFQGKITKEGYCEIYHSKHKVDIPPLFPIFYSNRGISRIRIGLTNSNDLIVDELLDYGVSFFIVSTGYRHRTQFFFKNSTGISKQQ